MRAAAVLLVASACTGEAGVLSVGLTTAPGSTVLDGVQTLRMELTSPRTVVMAERSGDGFELAIEVEASSASGALLVEGFAADGTLLASGSSPRFAFGAVTGRVLIYMAEPLSVGIAPDALAAPRAEFGTGALQYGAIFLGGTVAGVASDAVEVYNAYDHSLISGLALPEPRIAPAIGTGTLGVYVFGGLDSASTARAQLWRFDTQAPPRGSYADIGDKPGFERAGQTLVAIGDERFLMTGTPAAEIVALDGIVVSRDEIATLPRQAVTVVANDGTPTAIFVGSSTIVRYRQSGFDVLPTPGRVAATAVTLPGGKVGIVCGTTDLVRIDAATGMAETFPGLPAVAKEGCAVAATSRHLVIAGGLTATGVDAHIDIVDSATLAPIATATLAVPRSGATAIALPNDQILIVGGLDAAGMPTATIELFTPPAR